MMPPCPPLRRAEPVSNPYRTLGVSSDASPAQIKSAYRALALQYHPDRRRVVKRRRRLLPHRRNDNERGGINNIVGDERSNGSNDDDDDDNCKFATIAEAYAILIDTTRKAEYDRMRRLGAFDDDDHDDNNDNNINITGVRGTGVFGGGRGGIGSETIAKTQQPQKPDQRYVENLSGGYIKPGYVPPPQQSSSRQPSRSFSPFISSAMNGFSHHYQQNGTTTSSTSYSRNNYHSPTSAAAEAVIQNLQSQDSFIDDLQYKQQSTLPKKRTGIGFSFVPPPIIGAQSYLRHQLSIHVPSRIEIMANIVKGDGVRNGVNCSSTNSSRRRLHHLFGTKVTFSSQQTTTATVSNNDNTATKLKIDNNVNNKDDGGGGVSYWYDKLEMLILGACGVTATDLICGTGNGGKGGLSDEHTNSNNNVVDDDGDDIVNKNYSVTAKDDRHRAQDVPSSATNGNGCGNKVVKSYTTRISGGRRRIITHTARIIDEQPSSLLLSEDNGGDKGGMTKKKKVEIEVAEDGVVRHKYWYTKEEENND